MARLTARERASLPDIAFAYIDPAGQRRLPIHDEAHVRAALSRFDQVSFEDDAARERARTRLLRAAKKYGIVPVGFIDAQLRSQHERLRGEVQARSTDAATLPTGSVTFMMTDIEGSTKLLSRLGDRYTTLLADVRTVVRHAVLEAGGREVDARADEFFAVFERPHGAIEAAVALQRVVPRVGQHGRSLVRVRAGIHGGRPTLTDSGYVGLSVHTVARICAAGHGGQILVSDESRAAMQDRLPEGVTLRPLGRYRLQGLRGSRPLFQVEARGLRSSFPPLRAEATAGRRGPTK